MAEHPKFRAGNVWRKAEGSYRTRRIVFALVPCNRQESAMYALFEGDRQIGNPFPSEKEAWEAALMEGLVTDVPVADEENGQIIPVGYHVEHVADV